jgi:predicted nucleic acid-binding protein
LKRTYVDSGVLIAAARGSGKLAVKALAIIADTASREFVCSDYIKLEVIPKPTYFGHAAEVKFYEDFFSTVQTWLPFNVVHLEQALNEACVAGLSAVDAIHVVVAANSGCEEIVTSEKPTSAIHRTTLVQVMSIDE